MTLKFNDVTVNIENPKIQKKIRNFIFTMKEAPEKREKRRWTEDEVERLNTFVHNNIPLITIAKELNRSDKAVMLKMRAMGMEESKVINL